MESSEIGKLHDEPISRTSPVASTLFIPRGSAQPRLADGSPAILVWNLASEAEPWSLSLHDGTITLTLTSNELVLLNIDVASANPQKRNPKHPQE
jgi:hypothetical protein